MTEFDYRKMVRESVEDDPETRKIKEDHLKHIAEISKHLTEESEYEHLSRDEFESELIKKYHFKATKDTEDLYYYDDNQGIFVKGGEWMIKRESLNSTLGLLPPQWNKSRPILSGAIMSTGQILILRLNGFVARTLW